MGSLPGRTLINWRGSPARRAAIGIAAVHFIDHRIRNANELFQATEKDYEFHVSGARNLLGYTYPWTQLVLDPIQECGAPITPHKLLQRAEKVERYHEYWQDYQDMKPRIIRKALPILQDKPSEPTPSVRRFFTEDDLLEAMKLHGEVCAYCDNAFSGINFPVADHFIPFALGGRTELNNCVPACVHCNSEKGDQHPLEYYKKRIKRGQQGRHFFMRQKVKEA